MSQTIPGIGVRMLGGGGIFIFLLFTLFDNLKSKFIYFDNIYLTSFSEADYSLLTFKHTEIQLTVAPWNSNSPSGIKDYPIKKKKKKRNKEEERKIVLGLLFLML